MHESIKVIAMYHSNVVVIESKCSQLILLMKYNSGRERKVRNQTPADFERSRHAQMREKENPRKARQRAKRERTHKHPPVMRQSIARRSCQFIQCNEEKTSDGVMQIEPSNQSPRRPGQGDPGKGCVGTCDSKERTVI